LRAKCRAPRGQEPARGDPRGLPPALPANHDDDVRGALRGPADRTRAGRRLGAAPPARRRDGGGASRFAMADALHDAGHLSLSRSPEPLARRFAPPLAPRRGADRLAALAIGRWAAWCRRMIRMVADEHL